MSRAYQRLRRSKKLAQNEPTYGRTPTARSPIEAQGHIPPPTNAQRSPLTDNTSTGTVHRHLHVADEFLPLPPTSTNTERYPQEDKEDTEVITGSSVVVDPQSRANAGQHPPIDEEHFRTDRGPRSAEKPAVVKIEDLRTDDIVIAVMGPTGSGKSTFVGRASGIDARVEGHTLRSHTSEVFGVRFRDEESGRQVVLVDTPGFDDTFKSDVDILKLISDWLSASYSKHKLLSGILYLHRITDNRMAGTPLKNLRVFRKLCGRDALDRVYLTTTMWDEVDEEIGERRLHELKAEYWNLMITHGAQVERCRNDDDSPKRIIQRILGQESTRRVLLQEEMVELKKDVKETAAGQQLYSQLEALVEMQTELLRRIDKERKTTSDPKVLADLLKEHDYLRAQIDDKLRQMQELKLSRLKNLLRLFSLKRD